MQRELQEQLWPKEGDQDAKLPLAVSDPETQAAGSANCAYLKSTRETRSVKG